MCHISFVETVIINVMLINQYSFLKILSDLIADDTKQAKATAKEMESRHDNPTVHLLSHLGFCLHYHHRAVSGSICSADVPGGCHAAEFLNEQMSKFADWQIFHVSLLARR